MQLPLSSKQYQRVSREIYSSTLARQELSLIRGELRLAGTRMEISSKNLELATTQLLLAGLKLTRSEYMTRQSTMSNNTAVNRTPTPIFTSRPTAENGMEISTVNNVTSDKNPILRVTDDIISRSRSQTQSGCYSYTRRNSDIYSYRYRSAASPTHVTSTVRRKPQGK